MKISVLINNYNYESYIKECLDSVFSQTRLPDEVIVVDDGSTDNSMGVIADYSHRLTCISQDNQGQLAAMARGTKASIGDVICYLDSDDTWNAEHLKYIEDAFRSSANPDYVFTAMNKFGAKEGKLFPAGLPSDTSIPPTPQLMLVKSTWIGAPTSANAIKARFARKLFENLPEDLLREFKICADEILVYGASVLGCKKYAIKTATANYRIHGNNMYYGRNAELSPKAIASERRNKLIRQYAEKAEIKADIQQLHEEYLLMLQFLPRHHEYLKNYRMAPRRLKLPFYKRIYWNYKLWKTKLSQSTSTPPLRYKTKFP